MTKQQKEIIDMLNKLDEKMYNINASISGGFVSGIVQPTRTEMCALNGIIAKWIREIRKIKELLE